MSIDPLDTVLQAASTLEDKIPRASTPHSGTTTPIAPATIDRIPLSTFFSPNVDTYEVLDVNGVRAVYLKGKRRIGPMMSQMHPDDVLKLFPSCNRAEICSIMFRRIT